MFSSFIFVDKHEALHGTSPYDTPRLALIITIKQSLWAKHVKGGYPR